MKTEPEAAARLTITVETQLNSALLPHSEPVVCVFGVGEDVGEDQLLAGSSPTCQKDESSI